MKTSPDALASSLVLAALLTAAPAAAQPPAGECLVGPGLAATLLFPYFEVDLGDPAGLTSLIAVNNGTADPIVARAVLWTDWAAPTLSFDIYLAGFDVQTINVRSLFSGIVPSTGDELAVADISFCGSLPPFHDNPVLDSDEVAQLMADHTGQLGPNFPDCIGEDFGDDTVRGSITVDVVDECSGVNSAGIFTPIDNDPPFPYFVEGGSSGGIAVAENRLWGDLIFVDPANNAAQASEAIAIWADPSRFAGTNVFTFYGTITSGTAATNGSRCRPSGTSVS